MLDYKPPTFDKGNAICCSLQNKVVLELDGDCKTGCNWYLESDGAWYICEFMIIILLLRSQDSILFPTSGTNIFVVPGDRENKCLFSDCTHVAQDTDFFCIAQLIQPILSTDCGNFNDGSDDSQCYEVLTSFPYFSDKNGQIQFLCH